MSERLEKQWVTYTLWHEGRLCVVENVPARVSTETGEQFFAPATVERLHAIVRGQAEPRRTIEAPVFEFAE